VTSMLEVTSLHCGYGPVEVLHGIDLRVDAGEVVVVLGANGAGKTTMIRAVSGTIGRRGSVHLEGQDITRASPDGSALIRETQRHQGRLHPARQQGQVRRGHDRHYR